jgi:hypothetical protein
MCMKCMYTCTCPFMVLIWYDSENRFFLFFSFFGMSFCFVLVVLFFLCFLFRADGRGEMGTRVGKAKGGEGGVVISR